MRGLPPLEAGPLRCIPPPLRGMGPLCGADIRDDDGRRAADPFIGGRAIPLLAGEVSTCREILPRLRTLPRGTPRPAEPLRSSIRF